MILYFPGIEDVVLLILYLLWNRIYMHIDIMFVTG